MPKVLVILPYPVGEAPSQRFRIEQYLDLLSERGFEIDVRPFFSLRSWQKLYRGGHTLAKALGTASAFLRRLMLLSKVSRYDAVFVHREATPLGPAWFEWMVTRVFRKPMIFDFDDAIWLPNSSQRLGLVRALKWHRKIPGVIRRATMVMAGNEHLADYARAYNANVKVVPTTIDTSNWHNQTVNHNVPLATIGWTGSHSTAEYLQGLEAVLDELHRDHGVTTTMISNQPPSFRPSGLDFVSWKKETEVADLLRFHIGVMPLPDNPWTRGKCGFKLLQYMALGMVPVASPVAVNKQIIEHGVTGFLCHSHDDWVGTLANLAKDAELRIRVGKAAKVAIQERFSVDAWRDTYAELFSKVCSDTNR